MSSLIHKHMSEMALGDSPWDQPADISESVNIREFTLTVFQDWSWIVEHWMAENMKTKWRLLDAIMRVSKLQSYSLPSSSEQGSDHDRILHQLLFSRVNIGVPYQVTACLWKCHKCVYINIVLKYQQVRSESTVVGDAQWNERYLL